MAGSRIKVSLWTITARKEVENLLVIKMLTIERLHGDEACHAVCKYQQLCTSHSHAFVAGLGIYEAVFRCRQPCVYPAVTSMHMHACMGGAAATLGPLDH